MAAFFLRMQATYRSVAQGQPLIPAKAGIHLAYQFSTSTWIPAFAGLTKWCFAVAPSRASWIVPRKACHATSQYGCGSWRCLYSAIVLKPSISRSISSNVWAADREIRKRAVPAGTVGGRIAGAQIPISCNCTITFSAASLSPMISG